MRFCDSFTLQNIFGILYIDSIVLIARWGWRLILVIVICPSVCQSVGLLDYVRLAPIKVTDFWSWRCDAVDIFWNFIWYQCNEEPHWWWPHDISIWYLFQNGILNAFASDASDLICVNKTKARTFKEVLKQDDVCYFVNIEYSKVSDIRPH